LPRFARNDGKADSLRRHSCRQKFPLLSVLLTLLLALPAAAFELTGTITAGPDAAPVAGAKVWLAMGAQAHTAESGDDGRFRIENASAGAFDLVVLKAGYALGGQSGFLAGDADLDVFLPEAESVTLRVLGPDSLPIAGVRVSSMQLDGVREIPYELLRDHGLEQPRSVDGGTLTLPSLPKGGFMRLLLRHADYADLYVDYLAVRAEQPDLRLRPGVRVAGRVLAPGATGAAGAEVSAFRVTTAGQRKFGGAISDPEGFFHLRLEPGTYQLSARHADFATPPPQQLEVAADAAPEALLQLAEARILRGRVQLPDGKPAPGLLVSFRTGETITEEAFTGADGAFALRVADPQGMLLIEPPFGYVLSDGLGGIPVDFRDLSAVSAGDIRLSKRPRLRGIVRDADGAPVPRALVRTLTLPDPERIVTGDDGRFEYMPIYLPDDGVIGFRAEHPLRFLRSDFAAQFTESQEVEITLAPYVPSEKKPEEPAPESGNNVAGLLGKPAPPWAIARWFNSEPQTLDSLKGKVVVAVFWGLFDDTPQGLDTLDELYVLHELYKDTEDVVVIGIHDATSTEAEVEEFVKAWQVPFPIALDQPEFPTFGNYRITFIPHTLLLGKDGNVADSQPNEAILERIKVLRR